MKRSSAIFAVVLVAGALVDQWAKAWAEAFVRPRGIVTVLSGLADFRYVRNPGAFFSAGAQLEPGLRRALFVTSSALVILLITAVHAGTTAAQGRLRAALSLLGAGALGNFIDRVRTGEVVDFVHLHTGPLLRWATFNIADVFICAGLALLMAELLPAGTKSTSTRDSSAPVPSPSATTEGET